MVLVLVGVGGVVSERPCNNVLLQVCPSCRAFFRRSVQSGYNATYFCIKDGHCEVGLKTRKNCQYCRYKKCESCGMKTTWVLTEQERKEKFEGRRKKKSGSPGDEAVDNPGLVNRVAISREELAQVGWLGMGWGGPGESVFITSPVSEGSLYGDYRGSIHSNRAETWVNLEWHSP